MYFNDYLVPVFNYICTHWKFFISISLVLFFMFFSILTFLWITISFYIYKLLKKKVNEYSLNDYNLSTKKYLDLYGDLPIKNIYIVKKPISKYGLFLFHYFTSKKYINIKFNHISIIADVQLNNKYTKQILIEKNNSINITSNFYKYNDDIMKKIKIKNNNITLNQILHYTQKNMGKKKFFNWYIHKNNCEHFVYEILKSINTKYKKYKKHICQNEKYDKLLLNDYELHSAFTIINLKNFIDDFIYYIIS